jgi:hypothetical protein
VALQQTLDNHRLGLKSESYQMSIGELASLYESGELAIDPEFQRALRWSRSQRISFIESILLQLPLPSIFVAARDDGVWDLLDGLQRISTIFEFMGILKKDGGEPVPPMRLKGTEKIPELEGVVFEGGDDDPSVLSSPLRIDFRRQRMDVKIILRESSAEMKIDLFIRLSLGGTPFAAQDIRNAIMSSVNSAFRNWLEQTATTPQYLHTLRLSDKELKERYHEELLLIFLLAGHDSPERLAEVPDLNEGLDEVLTRLVRHRQSRLYEFDREASKQMFDGVFEALDRVRGANAFDRSSPGGAGLEAVLGLRKDIFVVVTAAMAEAWRVSSTERTLERVAGYLENPTPMAAFSEAVLTGRGLAHE